MHSAKSVRERKPSQARRSKLACTSIQALLALLLLMKRRPRSALCAPERVRSSCARCRLAARAARADSMPDVGCCPWLSARLWVRPKRLVRSCENWRAMDMASALSSCENCSSRCDEVRLIDGDREREDDDAPPPPAWSPRAPSGSLDAPAAAAAGSTLRRIMVSSSCRSSVTSTSSSPSSELRSEPRGEEPVLSDRGVVPAEPLHRWWWPAPAAGVAEPPLIAGPNQEPLSSAAPGTVQCLLGRRGAAVVDGWMGGFGQGGFGISGERRPRRVRAGAEPTKEEAQREGHI